MIAQDERKVKADIYAPMSEPCPNCGIAGYVSVGGVGKRVTARCGLCEHQWIPRWHDLSQHEKWLLDPHQAARDDAAKARARYGRVGGQANYTLFVNAKCFLDAAEFFMDGGNLLLAQYYLDLVKERISMLEARLT